jgi:hypothetical protein
MKDIATVLLASLFVLFSLMSLISADPTAGLVNSQESELEFRYALKR